MSHHRPYPAYKESGIEWLGEVPEHWSILPMRHMAMIRNGQDYKSVEVAGGPYPVIGSGGEFARASAYIYDGESVLLGRKGTIDKPLYINGRFWTVDTMFFTEIAPIAHAKYLYYVATTIPFGFYSTNTALPSMTQEALSSHMLAAPDITEQGRIALVLDRETTRIDSLIAKKNRFIGLLKEKRQTLITHAVTKGFNTEANRKDSGVEWIGNVPAHWKVLTLRRVISNIEQGWSPECAPWPADNGEWGVLKAGCVNKGDFRNSENKSLPAHLEPRPEYEVCDGDILMSRASGSPELVGSIALVRSPRPKLMFSDKIFRVKLTSIALPEFFVAALKSKFFRFQLENALSGGNGLANNLPQSALLDFTICLPPINEQQRIIEILFEKLNHIDVLSLKTQLSIDLLTEHRSALITAAVTGKIDLRESI